MRIILILLSILIGSAFAQTIPSDHKDIFEERLSKVLELTMKPNGTEQEMGLAGEKLLQFAEDYPESNLAKDAKYLFVLIKFIGAVTVKDKEKALKYLSEMETIVNLYPDGSLDELTCKKWKEMLGENASGTVYIPFKYIIPYMRGFIGFEFKDYQSTIDNFPLLKDNLDFDKDNTGVLAEEIYLPLVLSYKFTKRLDKWKDTVKEVIEKFPNTRLAQSMQRALEAH
jgi:hypothetical protein